MKYTLSFLENKENKPCTMECNENNFLDITSQLLESNDITEIEYIVNKKDAPLINECLEIIKPATNKMLVLIEAEQNSTVVSPQKDPNLYDTVIFSNLNSLTSLTFKNISTLKKFIKGKTAFVDCAIDKNYSVCNGEDFDFILKIDDYVDYINGTENNLSELNNKITANTNIYYANNYQVFTNFLTNSNQKFCEFVDSQPSEMKKAIDIIRQIYDDWKKGLYIKDLASEGVKTKKEIKPFNLDNKTVIYANILKRRLYDEPRRSGLTYNDEVKKAADSAKELLDIVGVSQDYNAVQEFNKDNIIGMAMQDIKKLSTKITKDVNQMNKDITAFLDKAEKNFGSYLLIHPKSEEFQRLVFGVTSK